MAAEEEAEGGRADGDARVLQTFGVISMRVDKLELSAGGAASVAVRASASTGAGASSASSASAAAGAGAAPAKHAPNALDVEVHNLLIIDHHTFEGRLRLRRRRGPPEPGPAQPTSVPQCCTRTS